uniref:DNA polymerase delta small subunit n=1 Tax=Riptortus pedestris TaxID=329032 RepID=R4WQ52_RIPPE|nr:DNA polymerase delta small subunit [Riptortus pedestris]
MKSIPDLNSDPKDKLFEENITRETCVYKDLSSKFRHSKGDYSRQYAHIYSKRLLQLKDTISKRAVQKWGNEVVIKRLAELQDDIGSKCFVIGTLFKDQELRPSILKELSEELEVIPQKKLVRFVSETDKLILEDELQRIVLVGNIDVNLLVTGVVCGVLGAEDSTGKFNVEDICFPGPLAPSPLTRQPNQSNKYALLLSGLSLACSADALPRLQLLVHWLSGWLGSDQESVSFVLIAGGLIKSSSEEKDGKIVGTAIDNNSDIITAVQLADDLLAELSESMNVELMPGQYDPTNYLLPQQPLHLRIFPKAMVNKSFNSGPNPHKFQLENLLVTGCSGEAVMDIGRYSDLTDPIEALEATFRWGHIAPTAPDSLGSYPYYEEDPFVIEEQPDIFFSSNHDEFQTKLLEFDHGDGVKQNTRLICIPSFSKTSSGVLVNLSTLDATSVSVDISN